MKKILSAFAMILALSACATNEQGGQLTGAVIGGVIGNQFGGGLGRAAATVIGVGIGAAIGGNVGRHMDVQDRQYTYRALESNSDGASTRWNNRDTGAEYVVTPQRSYRAADRAYCREYTTEVRINGRIETVYGTACQQPDGSWKAVK